MTYHLGVFPPSYNPGNAGVLRAFAAAVRSDYVTIHDETRYHDCDVAVIYGGVKRVFKLSMHKASILRQHKGPVLFLERGFLKRGEDIPGPLFGRQDEYFSVGWNGIAGHGDYCTEGVLQDRWDKLALPLQPWRSGPGVVLVCGQVPWDVSVQNSDHVAWCQKVVNDLRIQGYVVHFRPHPYALKRGVDYGVNAPLDMLPLDQSLRRASWVVTYSSSVGVQSVVQGIPTVAYDRGSMAWDVSAHSIQEMKSFRPPDRVAWAARLAYSQWRVDEFQEAWSHVRQWLGHNFRKC